MQKVVTNYNRFSFEKLGLINGLGKDPATLCSLPKLLMMPLSSMISNFAIIQNIVTIKTNEMLRKIKLLHVHSHIIVITH